MRHVEVARRHVGELALLLQCDEVLRGLDEAAVGEVPPVEWTMSGTAPSDARDLALTRRASCNEESPVTYLVKNLGGVSELRAISRRSLPRISSLGP